MSQPPYTNQPPALGFMPPEQQASYPPYGSSPHQPPVSQQPGYPAYPNPPQGGYPPPGNFPPAYGHPQGGLPPPVPGQPLPQGWMAIPPSIPNCPPGLEYLTQIDQLLVHQKVELLEAFTGFETNNKYQVKNSMGQKVYFAAEENDCCTRNCCGPLRPFDMKILDNAGRPVIHLYRPFRCDSCWYPCCLQELEVESPPGNIVGYVKQEWSICIPRFKVCNAAGDTVLRIEGPFCTFGLCRDVEFTVLSRDGSNEVGRIVKQWTGMAREAFTDADHFGISFPMDLDVKVKATLLGACFLIDFMFFEKSANQENDSPGMF